MMVWCNGGRGLAEYICYAENYVSKMEFGIGCGCDGWGWGECVCPEQPGHDEEQFICQGACA